MQAINQTATTELIVDGEQAKKELELVNERIKDVDKQLRKARKDGDEELKKSLTQQKNQLVENRRSLQKEAIEVNRILNSLSTAKPKELNNTIRTLTNQLNSPAVRRGSEEWKYLNEQILRCKKELRQVNKEMQIGETRASRIGDSFGKMKTKAMAAIAVITGLTVALNKYRQLNIEQEEKRLDLKALTGLGDDDVSWLEQQAVELSTTVTESGVRIRQSAAEILDAYKLVGSAKPELLQNKEALKAVTEQSLILAAASGVQLTAAVDAVTLSLNQYGDGADQASRYVNVLAAGSKAGAASVESQSRAIRNAGVIAAGANISIEELQGTIQTLAERGIKDESAGTGLKNFFLALQTGADETNPEIVGLTAALEELGRQQLGATELWDRFGKEGYNVAKTLIDNRDKVVSYTEAVTGTATASEQASIKSESMAAKMATVRNKLNQAGQTLAEKFNPVVLEATNWIARFAEILMQLPNYLRLYSQWIVLAGVSLVAFNGKLILSTALKWKQVVATQAQTVATKAQIIAQRALNLVMNANPIAKVITLVGTLVAAFITWYDHSIKVQAVTAGLWESLKELGSRAADVFTGLWTILQAGLWGRPETLKKAWAEGTALIKNATSDMGNSIAKSFWDSYNKTMEEGQKTAVEPEVVSSGGSDQEELKRQRQAEVEASIKAARQKAAEEAEKKRQEEARKAAEKAEKERKKQLKAALDANKNLYTSLKADTKQKFLEQQVSEAEMYRILELLELQSLESRLRILQRFGEDSSSEEERIIDMRIAAMKKLKETEKLSYWTGSIEAEEEDPELEALIERTKQTLSFRQTALQNDYEKGLITQKEYQDRERELLAEHLEQMLSARIGFAEMVNELASQAAQLVSTLIRREEIAVETKYAKQLKAAKGNAEETARLQEQMEEEKKNVKKKYADVEFAMSAAQIVANTSAAIMKLWMQLGIAAIPFQTLVGAIGVAQLAMANTQRQNVKNLWTGGYTGSGAWDEPKGIVHSNEFVGNRYAVGNPAVNKVFRMIDAAQKSNTIASINESDIIRMLSGNRVVERLPSSTGQTIASNDIAMVEVLSLVAGSLSDLKKQMEQGTVARTYVTGDGGTKSARDKYDKMLKNVTRYTKQ